MNNSVTVVIPTYNENRPVPGYGGRYIVTDEGQVISLLHATPKPLRSPPMHGYHTVSLRKDGRTQKYPVHVLVLTAFVGPRPEGDIHAAHTDGNKDNNRLDNLSWKSRADNEADKVIHGRSNRGERQGRHKLTRDQVHDIRRRASTESQRTLANEYNVYQQTISAVVTGRTWKETA